MTTPKPDATASLSKAAAEWLVDAMPADALFAFLTSLDCSVDSFFRGFKVDARNVRKKPVLNRLRVELCQNADFRSRFLEWPRAPWNTWRMALQAIDQDWLLGNWRTLLRARAGREIGIAMAVDPREPVRSRGARVLGRKRFWKPLERGRNETAAPEEWEALGRLIGLHAQDKQEAPGEAAGLQEALQKRIETLEKQRDGLRRQVQKSRAQSRETETSLQAASEQCEIEKRDLRRELREAQRRCEQLAQDAQAQVRSRVSEFRRAALGVTDRVDRVRRELRRSGSASLLKRSEDVLAQQRRINEKHGTMSALRAELARLQEAEKQLEECVTESVVVLPELDAVRRDVRQRIGELRELLPEPGAERPPELAVDLLSQIKEAPLTDDGSVCLQGVVDALAQPAVAESLGPSWVRRLQETVRQQRRLLVVVREQPDIPPPDGEDEAEGRDAPGEVWNVTERLASEKLGGVVWLFIDGYNATKTVPELARAEEQHGLSEARATFVSLCRQKAPKFGHLEIVFDGADAVSAREELDGLTVVFSAQLRSSQNADRYIVDRLAAVHDDAPALWLVTEDYGLRWEAERFCDAFITPSDFYRFLTE